ncbi:tRNA dihydrouridine synthase DusB [Paracoccus sp. S-4012]|uniref:tRNA dihydrouridine synthase DusB n=1 Tax=Paracoccus sp. S-4012 TaxID=2665648 RepID=UPI0012B08CC3|nr:tRNA dihydrouridine synthase DusB [Paracoccus sp. S-4012]MRX51541.1 tRNA dihydrouridine synthase DusB [Paracoccus sp. S-4012]
MTVQPIRLGSAALAFPVILAPMAGITDLPFRRMVAKFGAGLMVSEMVASSEIASRRPSSRALARARAEVEGAVPVSVQIAGREADVMAETARRVADLGARIVDINMGCPAKKVTGGLAGAALMRDLDRALSLIEAVAEAVPQLPVTLKMRLGWDADCLNAPALASRAAAAGVRMLAVHGRTRAQFYTGSANWDAIAAVGVAVASLPDAPPLVANGDVTDAASARAALSASGAAAVMVGRGAQGRPWRLQQIAHELWGAAAPVVPRGAALAAAVTEHYDDILDFYGVELGGRVARKHLFWWAEAAGIPEARTPLVQAPSPAEARREIAARFADAPGETG